MENSAVSDKTLVYTATHNEAELWLLEYEVTVKPRGRRYETEIKSLPGGEGLDDVHSMTQMIGNIALQLQTDNLHLTEFRFSYDDRVVVFEVVRAITQEK